MMEERNNAMNQHRNSIIVVSLATPYITHTDTYIIFLKQIRRQ